MRWRIEHLPLAWPLARRDIAARYRGSLVGVGWALLAPLAMVAVYALVFQGVFKARWAGSSEAAGGVDFAARLFAGLIVFSAVAEVATRATRLMQDNANLVKRVVFPLELLSVALVMQVAVHTALQMLVLAALLIAIGVGPQWSWLWLPAAWAWSVALQLALALGLAALGCYLRDLQQAVPLVMSGLLFLSPVFYPGAAAPQALQSLLQFNPLTAPIELSRAAWFGDPIAWSPMLLSLLGLLIALPLAHALFQRLRPGFADLV
ncbi:ABC transporter permease [Aquincola sp. S2]|uniref:Transport permease protein n=1 Tax=Pseudaquabacterium terrae TaxID=2732868 RepID=A0ABX2EDX4_9BURK|nr:ABC transporter permease [Aquabacterium terrae]NRF66811.1 ABC transporter permease [Aquabacterium terrae]